MTAGTTTEFAEPQLTFAFGGGVARPDGDQVCIRFYELT
jgi:hypothetical protein